VAKKDGDAVMLYDVASGVELRRCGRPKMRIRSLAFARGGRFLVAGDPTGVTIWETASGAEVLQLSGHTAPINCVAVSPDGKHLATGSDDTTVILWDLAAAWHETAANFPAGKARPKADDLLRDLHRDGATAYRALWALAAEGDKVLPLIKRDLLCNLKSDDERISRLIAVLADPDETVRDAALKALRVIGADAVPALRKELASTTSDKLRARLRGLLTDLEVAEKLTLSNEALYPGRAVDLLELIGTTEAQKLLKLLAGEGRTSRLRDEAKAALARTSRKR